MSDRISELQSAIQEHPGIHGVVDAMNAGKQDEVTKILETTKRLKTDYSKVFSEFYTGNSDKLDISAEAIQELTTQKNSEDNEFYQKLAFNFYISNSIDDFGKAAGVSGGFGFHQGFIQFSGDKSEEILRPIMIQGAKDKGDEKVLSYIERFFSGNEEDGWLRIPGGDGKKGNEENPAQMLEIKERIEEYMFLSVKKYITNNLIPS